MPFREAEEKREAEEERRRIAQSLTTWVLFFLTFIVGLIGLLPHLRFYDDILFFVLTIPLCLVYLGFAVGVAYSLVRLSLGMALLLKWRKQLSPGALRKLDLPLWYKRIFRSPWYEKILFDKKRNLRERRINISKLIIFLFWFLIMIGKLLAST